MAILITIVSSLLSLLNFPPLFWVVDGHALAHISAAALPIIWGQFAVSDCLLMDRWFVTYLIAEGFSPSGNWKAIKSFILLKLFLWKLNRMNKRFKMFRKQHILRGKLEWPALKEDQVIKIPPDMICSTVVLKYSQKPLAISNWMKLITFVICDLLKLRRPAFSTMRVLQCCSGSKA